MLNKRTIFICLLMTGLLIGESAETAGMSGTAAEGRLTWRAPAIGSENELGTIVLETLDGSTILLLAPKLLAGSSRVRCISSRDLPSGRGIELAFAQDRKQWNLRITRRQDGSRSAFSIKADEPGLRGIQVGAWLPEVKALDIAVPYYTGVVSWLPVEGMVGGFWWDWKATAASRLDGRSVAYLPKTDGSLNALDEVLVVALSTKLADALPAIDNPPSPYMAELAGRVVVDIWGGDFASVADGIRSLRSWGLKDGALIVHDWQRFGYDNGLPAHFPANEALGGDEGLKELVKVGLDGGYLVALHENYVDYYPDYPLFDERDIALNPDGSRMKAWFNKGTGIQAFATKPDRMVALANAVSPEIRRIYSTNAVFIDVNSSTGVSNHGDFDARVSGAATLRLWTSSNQDLWTYERLAHGGPCFGEGSNHWYYSGLLDGVEAQMGAGVKQNSGETIPLLVDFDLLRIHPLQVNHGMGYYERWLENGASIAETESLDAYRMQEIAFAHAPFLGDALWHRPLTAMTEFGLVSPVAERYGRAKVASIQYRVAGKWVPTETAAASGEFDCVRTAWDNGLTVVANASKEPVDEGGLSVPRFGWLAKGDDILAYTAMLQGHIVDYCSTPDCVFADSRNMSDSRRANGEFAEPTLADCSLISPRTLTMSYHWNLFRDIPSGYKVFVHFIPASGGHIEGQRIAFQGDHELPLEAGQWRSGRSFDDGPYRIVVPASLPDGSYSIMIGMYKPDGPRLLLSGRDDGTNRIVIGTLTLSDKGRVSSFSRQEPAVDGRLNSDDPMVDFGPVRTDGLVSIQREGMERVLRVLPADRQVAIEIDGTRFPRPVSLRAEGVDGISVPTVARGNYWSFALTGAASYHWTD
jgi:hypothetical protein